MSKAKPQYILSREAGRDLEEIEDYTATTWGDAQAKRYLSDIFQALEHIAKNPDAGRSRADIPPPYLVYAVGSHVIVYRHNQQSDAVEVLNILHPSMNIEHRMSEALDRMKRKKV